MKLLALFVALAVIFLFTALAAFNFDLLVYNLPEMSHIRNVLDETLIALHTHKSKIYNENEEEFVARLKNFSPDLESSAHQFTAGLNKELLFSTSQLRCIDKESALQQIGFRKDSDTARYLYLALFKLETPLAPVEDRMDFLLVKADIHAKQGQSWEITDVASRTWHRRMPHRFNFNDLVEQCYNDEYNCNRVFATN